MTQTAQPQQVVTRRVATQAAHTIGAQLINLVDGMDKTIWLRELKAYMAAQEPVVHAVIKLEAEDVYYKAVIESVISSSRAPDAQGVAVPALKTKAAVAAWKQRMKDARSLVWVGEGVVKAIYLCTPAELDHAADRAERQAQPYTREARFYRATAKQARLAGLADDAPLQTLWVEPAAPTAVGS